MKKKFDKVFLILMGILLCCALCQGMVAVAQMAIAIIKLLGG